jgi:hypothetical protein
MTITKKKFIEVPIHVKHELSRKYGVSIQTVRLALRFNTDSDVAKAIRSDAMSKGGFISHRAV